MGDHQREGVGVRRPLVDEMDVQPVDFVDELIESVERGLTRAPVVFVGPIVGQFAGVRQRYALAPVVHAFGLRPAGARQARPQIFSNVVGDVDAKRLHAPDLAIFRERNATAKIGSRSRRGATLARC